MELTNSDIAELTDLRHRLHRHPEISGQERQTAQRVRAALDGLRPDQMACELGGHGLAACFDGREAGPTVMFRCELDALPIAQISDAPYCSKVPETAHLCGHDGHMAILTGLARRLSRQRPARGRVILLFQPAEETGAGANAVLADPKFAGLAPDYAFALHNLPGVALGAAALKPGPVCCASRGLDIRLTGTPAHASQPETGRSPMSAISQLMPALDALSRGRTRDPDFALVTVTHANMGAPAFGIAPGAATVFATLRTLTDDGMAALCDAALSRVGQIARDHGLEAAHQYHDVFHHCDNHPEATGMFRAALEELGIRHDDGPLPWRPSEDFGRFGDTARAAMLFLGSGTDQPPLHNPHYDFPDDLIPIGVRVFERVARNLLG
ncbi:amidohydrolase [Roseovarius sp. CAU 1744]|uniref:amidohydrolase n=1 Tax=Roseovarius sp. CAU 1744 TaxID=3140368 RepID=UPI00325A8600